MKWFARRRREVARRKRKIFLSLRDDMAAQVYYTFLERTITPGGEGTAWAYARALADDFMAIICMEA